MKEKFASSTFNDFLDVDELYRSYAGAVYRAKFKYDSKQYVLKERKIPELGKQKDLLSEAKLLAQLQHPNAIRCEETNDVVQFSLFWCLKQNFFPK